MMALITVNGQFGSPALSLAQNLADRLNQECLDEAILAMVAHRLGASVEAISEKETRVGSLTDRIIYHIRSILERSAIAGTGGEPFFGPGMETILLEHYTDLSDEPLNSPKQVHDQQFVNVTKSIIEDAANSDDLVIVGRASNIILKDRPHAIHIGVMSSYESRVTAIMDSRGCSWPDAERRTLESEKARLFFFKKYFASYANDPMIFDIVVNMNRLDLTTVTEMVMSLVKALPEKLKASNGI